MLYLLSSVLSAQWYALSDGSSLGDLKLTPSGILLHIALRPRSILCDQMEIILTQIELVRAVNQCVE